MRTSMMKMFVYLTLCCGVATLGAAEQTGDYGDVPPLDQGWTEQDRDTFYHLPQGSPIIPYEYFLALEQAGTETLFSDRANLEAMGMLYWTSQSKSALNPDNLPIGLTIDRKILGNEPMLGMNCAACHVTELTLNGQKTLIDGGVSLFDFGRFSVDLLDALARTDQDPAKFDRFAHRLLGKEYSAAAADKLHRRFHFVWERRTQWADDNAPDVQPGPGRVDALNVILNRATSRMLERPDNAIAPNAPVSFPPLWGAPYLTNVQYNGVVPNRGAGALGRNVGQVLGVFGEVSLVESTIPGGYFSSVRIDNLQSLEATLETLKPPRWSELAGRGVLPTLNQPLVDAGASVYAANCAQCHQVVHPENYGELASIPVHLMPLKDIGTDGAAAMGFVSRLVATGPLEGRPSAYVRGEPFCATSQANAVLGHITVGVIMHDVSDAGIPVLASLWGDLKNRFTKFFGDFLGMEKGPVHHDSSAQQKLALSDDDLMKTMRAAGASEQAITTALQARRKERSAVYGQLAKDSPELHGERDDTCHQQVQPAQYRARPLDGAWASAPYLHNGSVPTLKDLLRPVAERPTQFYVGSSEFDPVNVGFVQEKTGRGFRFDTRIAGNYNTGHEFGTTLSEADKLALIEYLKSL